VVTTRKARIDTPTLRVVPLHLRRRLVSVHLEGAEGGVEAPIDQDEIAATATSRIGLCVWKQTGQRLFPNKNPASFSSTHTFDIIFDHQGLVSCLRTSLSFFDAGHLLKNELSPVDRHQRSVPVLDPALTLLSFSSSSIRPRAGG
jgi:hypothetical protein